MTIRQAEANSQSPALRSLFLHRLLADNPFIFSTMPFGPHPLPRAIRPLNILSFGPDGCNRTQGMTAHAGERTVFFPA
jgi:hypothetical protein